MNKSQSQAAHGRVRGECFQEENGVSSPILPPQGSIVTGTASSAGTARSAGANPAGAAFPLAPSPAYGESLRPLPASPPPGILDEIARAAQAHERLRAEDRELHFAHDTQSGQMTIEVRDCAGNVLRTLSPSEALDVAAGKPLD